MAYRLCNRIFEMEKKKAAKAIFDLLKEGLEPLKYIETF